MTSLNRRVMLLSLGLMALAEAADDADHKPRRRMDTIRGKMSRMMEAVAASSPGAVADEDAVAADDEEFWHRLLQGSVEPPSQNFPPIAVDDRLGTQVSDSVCGNVMDNDSDPDGDQIRVLSLNSNQVTKERTLLIASGAIVTIDNEGNMCYDQNGAFAALPPGRLTGDTFDYTISDPFGLTSSATVTIIIRNDGDGPVPEPTAAPPTTGGVPTQGPTVSPTFQCNLTPEQRRAQLTLMAVDVSGATAPVTPGTPQNNALEWLISEDAFFVCPQDASAVQRYVMGVFFFAAGGPGWTNCVPPPPNQLGNPEAVAAANAACALTLTPPPLGTDVIPRVSGTDAWLTPVHECFWGGAECDADSLTIDRIEFEDNNLSGSLPDEVGRLEDIRFIYLERGGVGGTIPSSYGDLENLLVFDIDFNQVSGTIPETFYDNTNMLQFDLNNNTLTGTLDPRLGDMTALRFLQIGGNPMTGTIPTELGNLELLIVGGFEFTDIQGSMPQSICDNRVPPIGGGFIRSLIADCRGPGAQLECNCCTECKA